MPELFKGHVLKPEYLVQTHRASSESYPPASICHCDSSKPRVGVYFFGSAAYFLPSCRVLRADLPDCARVVDALKGPWRL